MMKTFRKKWLYAALLVVCALSARAFFTSSQQNLLVDVSEDGIPTPPPVVVVNDDDNLTEDEVLLKEERSKLAAAIASVREKISASTLSTTAIYPFYEQLGASLLSNASNFNLGNASELQELGVAGLVDNDGTTYFSTDDSEGKTTAQANHYLQVDLGSKKQVVRLAYQAHTPALRPTKVEIWGTNNRAAAAKYEGEYGFSSTTADWDKTEWSGGRGKDGAWKKITTIDAPVSMDGMYVYDNIVLGSLPEEEQEAAAAPKLLNEQLTADEVASDEGAASDEEPLTDGEAFEVDGVCYEVLSADDQTCAVVEKPSKYINAVVVPSTVEYGTHTLAVTSVSEGAFSGCSKLTSVTLGNNVQSIGDEAFYGCTRLTSVTLGHSVRTIGASAFENCRRIMSMTFPNSVTSIGANAMCGCSGLTSLVLGSGLEEIGDNAFEGCVMLEEITCLGAVPPTLGEEVFFDVELSECSLSIPANAAAAYAAAEGWSDFQVNVQITDGTEFEVAGITYRVVSVDDQTCEVAARSGLYTGAVEIPASVEYSSHTLNVIGVGAETFKDCTSLVSVTLPSSITYVGDNAFDGCEQLAEIVSASAVPPTLGNDVFANVQQSVCVLKVSAEVFAAYNAAEGWNAFQVEFQLLDALTFEANGISYRVLSATEQTCEVIASQGEAYVDEVEIPSSVVFGTHTLSVTGIGAQAFQNCRSLTAISLPNTIVSIGDLAFDNCRSLTSVVLPNSVASMGAGAFKNCVRLTSLSLGTGLETIGASAFEDCDGLTHITCLATVPPTLGANAFVGVAQSECILSVPAESVEAYAAAEGWSDFQVNVQITDGTEFEVAGITYRVVSVDDQTCEVAARSGLYTGAVEIPASVEYSSHTLNVIGVGAETFKDCTSLVSVTLPSSITYVGDNAFDGCEQLAEIVSASAVPPTLGNDVFANVQQSVCVLKVSAEAFAAYNAADGWNAFQVEFQLLDALTFEANGISYRVLSATEQTCEAIASQGKAYVDEVEIPSSVVFGTHTLSVTGIGAQAFQNCRSLTAISLPNTIVSIGDLAFDNCRSLTSVTLPNSVASVGEGAFKNCVRLTSLSLGTGLETIGASAFEDCDGLTHITCLATVPPTLGTDAFVGVAQSECILSVPAEAVEAYAAAEGWSNFKVEPILVDGLAFEVEGIKYQVLSAEEETCEVVASEPKYSGEVVIPATAPLGSHTLTVKAIGANAFEDCTELTAVTIPNTVTHIGDRAFAGCTQLVTITCQALTPPALGENVFEGVDQAGCVLIVPDETASVYDETAVWNEFLRVAQESTNGYRYIRMVVLETESNVSNNGGPVYFEMSEFRVFEQTINAADNKYVNAAFEAQRVLENEEATYEEVHAALEKVESIFEGMTLYTYHITYYTLAADNPRVIATEDVVQKTNAGLFNYTIPAGYNRVLPFTVEEDAEEENAYDVTFRLQLAAKPINFASSSSSSSSSYIFTVGGKPLQWDGEHLLTPDREVGESTDGSLSPDVQAKALGIDFQWQAFGNERNGMYFRNVKSQKCLAMDEEGNLTLTDEGTKWYLEYFEINDVPGYYLRNGEVEDVDLYIYNNEGALAQTEWDAESIAPLAIMGFIIPSPTVEVTEPIRFECYGQGQYLTLTADGADFTTSPAYTTDEYVVLVPSQNNGYYLKSGSGYYLGTIPTDQSRWPTTTSEEEAQEFVLYPVTNYAYSITIKGGSTEFSQSVVINSDGVVGRGNPSTILPDGQWRMVYASDDYTDLTQQVLDMKAQYEDAYPELYENLGKVGYPTFNYSSYITRAEEIRNAEAESPTEQTLNLVRANRTLYTGLRVPTFRFPQAEHFYALRNGDVYLAATAAQKSVSTTDNIEDKNAIFYLESDGRLLSYGAGGYYLYTGSAVSSLESNGYAEGFDLDISLETAPAFSLTSRHDQGHLTISGKNLWTFEDVKVLPLSIPSVPYATFYSPVAIDLEKIYEYAMVSVTPETPDPEQPSTGGGEEPEQPGTGGEEPEQPSTGGGEEPEQPGQGGEEPEQPSTGGGEEPEQPSTGGGEEPEQPGQGGEEPEPKVTEPESGETETRALNAFDEEVTPDPETGNGEGETEPEEPGTEPGEGGEEPGTEPGQGGEEPEEPEQPAVTEELRPVHPRLTFYLLRKKDAETYVLSPVHDRYLPARTGVVVYWSKGVEDFNNDAYQTGEFYLPLEYGEVPKGHAFYKENLLVGETYAQKTTDVLDAEGAGKSLVKLARTKDENGQYVDCKVGFYNYVGKALRGFSPWVVLTEEQAARGFSLNFDTDEVTAIAIQQALDADHGMKDVYDLSGRRVQHSTNGVYIINGKKVIIKK